MKVGENQRKKIEIRKDTFESVSNFSFLGSNGVQNREQAASNK